MEDVFVLKRYAKVSTKERSPFCRFAGSVSNLTRASHPVLEGSS